MPSTSYYLRYLIQYRDSDFVYMNQLYCNTNFIHKLMIRINRFGFSTIALISGAPKYDRYLTSIANTLQKTSKGSVNLVGVVGSEWQSSLSKVYASSDMLDNYEFEVTRAYNTYHEDIQDCRVMPYRAYTHYKNYTLVQQLQKQRFFEEVFSNKIDAIATVGNFSLSLRISQKLNEYCKETGKVRPFTALFHRQITQRTINNEQFLDFQYYNVEKAHHNGSGYIFPSLCVGYEGLYRAFQHLQTFRKDHENDSFLSENFSYDVSQLVAKSRSQFRAARNISEDRYLIYIDAGNNPSEIQFSFKSYKDGLRQFFSSSAVSTVDPNHFEFLVYSPQGKLTEQIKGKIGFLPSNIKITFITEKDKYAAISASDFGLLHNGEAPVQAAALQLPSLVVDNRSNVHAYFNNLYNGHASPLNIATNFEGYEDLCGSLTAIGTKIGSIILKNFQTPKLRYYYAKLYRQQIQLILSKSSTNPRLSVSETGLETGCKHLLQKAQIYNKLGATTFRKQSERKSALAL